MYARSEENESIFLFRMIRVSYKSAKLVGKCSFGLIERDAMLLTICRLLALIPFEDKMTHELHCRYCKLLSSGKAAHQQPKNENGGRQDRRMQTIQYVKKIQFHSPTRPGLKGTKPKSNSNSRPLTTDHGPRTPDPGPRTPVLHHRRHLEDRQIHGHNHAADDHADEHDNDRLQQAGKRVDCVVHLFLVEAGHLVEHGIE